MFGFGKKDKQAEDTPALKDVIPAADVKVRDPLFMMPASPGILTEDGKLTHPNAPINLGNVIWPLPEREKVTDAAGKTIEAFTIRFHTLNGTTKWTYADQDVRNSDYKRVIQTRR